jgi:hypothetical protein
MGIYLNPGAGQFLVARSSKIYVDKSALLGELDEVFGTEQRFVCVSRPRRFGKTMAANMVCAYYDRTVADDVFDGLAIARAEGFSHGRKKFDVLRINMQEFLSRAKDMAGLLSRLRRIVLRDLFREYPDIEYFDWEDLVECMQDVYQETQRPFVIVIDEWDCIFREYPHDAEAQRQYLDFLRDWLKDKEYIGLAYMTGILPVKKYGTHSALNMFTEYSMENPGPFAPYVGFTGDEVRHLCAEYGMDFGECCAWYDGYSFPNCEHVFSPKSVVEAMLRREYDDYWTKTETYEALKVYIDLNEGGLRDAIVKMMAGGRQKINTLTFTNDMTTFTSADDVMTLLVHLGYLGYDRREEEVFIPNNEILREYIAATKQGEEWQIVSRAVQASDALLAAVFEKDAAAVAGGVERAHLETSHIQYNDENALSYTLSLAFYSARRFYNIVRELPAGKGFADLAFLPRPQHAEKPALVIELKWDKTADTAIRQIKEKGYAGSLAGFAGKVLLVGVSYDKKTRRHEAVIEEWQSSGE